MGFTSAAVEMVADLDRDTLDGRDGICAIAGSYGAQVKGSLMVPYNTHAYR
jgi:hypothetical protein